MTLQPVSFHGDQIFVIEYDGEPYVQLKSVVENLGLDLKSQRAKINANSKRWGGVMITLPSKGGRQSAVCIPLRKLPGYLATINPSKVRNELRPKVALYQDECDDALWAYWNNEQQQPTIDMEAITKAIRTEIRAELRRELKKLPAPGGKQPYKGCEGIDPLIIDMLRRVPKDSLGGVYALLSAIMSGLEYEWKVTFKH